MKPPKEKIVPKEEVVELPKEMTLEKIKEMFGGNTRDALRKLAEIKSA